MIYFAGQILILLLFTIPLWFGIGWWICSLERTRSQKAREAEWTHHLNTLRRDRDAFRDEAEKAHGQIRVLENRRADGKSPPASASGFSNKERDSFRQRVDDLQTELSTTDRKMLGFSQQVETLHQQNVEREDILNQLRGKLGKATEMIKERDREIERLNATSNFHTVDALSKHEELQNIILAQEKSIAELKVSGTETEDAPRLRELESIIHNQDRMIEELNRRMQLATKVQGGDLKDHVSHLESLIAEQDQTIGNLRLDNQHLQEAIDTSELEQMHEAMAEQEAVITQLRRVLEKSTRQAPIRKKISPPVQAAIPRSGDLFDQPVTADHISGDSQHAAASVIADKTEQASSDYAGVKLYETAPENHDDLKKIRGIGPAFERTLNRIGVYQYEQIASWSHEDVDWVAGKIHSFPDRIHKGEWVEQARALRDS